MSSRPSTLGELRESGWESVPVKDELRRNAIARIRDGIDLFPGVIGFDAEAGEPALAVRFDTDKSSVADIVRVLEDAGLPVCGVAQRPLLQAAG